MSAFSIPQDYRPAAGTLDKRVVLITGAGGGLGSALSLAVAGLGATVVLLGRTVAKLENTYDAIIAAGGPTPAIYPLDLAGATIDDYQQLAETLGREMGRLDSLIHCAATLGPMTPLAGYPAKDWQVTLQTNLTGPMFLTQACLNMLLAGDNASVVFTADDRSRAYWGCYGISKAAVVSSMQVLADELDNNRNESGRRIVSTNALQPGPMRTQLRRIAYPGEDAGTIPAVENYLNKFLYLIDPKTEKPNGIVIKTDAQPVEVNREGPQQ